MTKVVVALPICRRWQEVETVRSVLLDWMQVWCRAFTAELSRSTSPRTTTNASDSAARSQLREAFSPISEYIWKYK